MIAADQEPTGGDGFRGMLSRVSWRAVPPLAAALAIGLGALTLVQMSARPLMLLVLAIAVAEALQPVVNWLERWVRKRVVAVTIVFAVLLTAIGLVVWALAPSLVQQTQDLIQRLPELGTDLRTMIRDAGIPVQMNGGVVGPLVDAAVDFAISIPTMLLGALLDAIVVVFLAIYWLIGSRDIRSFSLSLVPVERRERVASVTAEMGDAMGGYVRAVFITSIIMGIAAWIGLSVIGVRYPLALGVLTVLGEAVPVFGPIIVGVIVTALALLQSLTKALIAALLFTALAQIEGNVLTPNIMRSQTDVPQTLVLFAILVGAALGGVLGILAAIPIAAAVRVLVVRLAPRDPEPEVEPEPEPETEPEAGKA